MNKITDKQAKELDERDLRIDTFEGKIIAMRITHLPTDKYVEGAHESRIILKRELLKKLDNLLKRED